MSQKGTGNESGGDAAAPDVHPTALVDPGAELGPGVVVGPYAVIEDRVRLGAGCVVGAHCVVHGGTSLGERNRLAPHVVLGGAPQDVSYDGGPTRLEIGDGNLIREGFTAHRSTNVERPTRIGSRCFLMAHSHVGHDCRVGDDVVLVNQVLLGGHVEVGDGAIVGGAVVVHQFCRIGGKTMIAGTAGINKDILPFTMVHESPARHYRLNTVGLRRAGVKAERYRALERAYRRIATGERDLSDLPETPEIAHLVAWLAAPSKRGLAKFLKRGKAEEKAAAEG